MSPRLADEKVGPQRSKVRALLHPKVSTRMRRVERPESTSKQASAARERNLSWHSRLRRAGRPRLVQAAAAISPGHEPRGKVRLPP